MSRLIGTEVPKLNFDTLILPTADGVWLRNDRGSFTIRGKHAYALIERLLRALNGDHTVSEILLASDQGSRQTIHNLLATLMERGFARDKSKDQPHSLTLKIMQAFQSTIDLIASYVDSPEAAFEKFRRARVGWIGSSPSPLDFVRACLDVGVSHLTVAGLDSTELSSLRATLPNQSDPELNAQITYVRQSTAGSDDYCASLIADCDYVVYACPGERDDTLLECQRLCRAHGVILLPLTVFSGVAMIGPLVDSSGPCWECSIRRLHDSRIAEQSADFSKASSALAVNVLVLEILKHCVGAPEIQLAGQVFLLDLATLQGTLHRILSHPLCKSCSALPAPIKQDYNDHQNMKQASLDVLIEDHTGVIVKLGNDMRDQSLVLSCVASSADPRGWRQPEPQSLVLAFGNTHQEARSEAVVQALIEYSLNLNHARHSTVLSPAPTAIDGWHERAILRDVAINWPDQFNFVKNGHWLVPVDRPPGQYRNTLTAGGVGSGAGYVDEAILHACIGSLRASLSACVGKLKWEPAPKPPEGNRTWFYARALTEMLRTDFLILTTRYLGLPAYCVRTEDRILATAVHVDCELSLLTCLATALGVAEPGARYVRVSVAKLLDSLDVRSSIATLTKELAICDRYVSILPLYVEPAIKPIVPFVVVAVLLVKS